MNAPSARLPPPVAFIFVEKSETSSLSSSKATRNSAHLLVSALPKQIRRRRRRRRRQKKSELVKQKTQRRRRGNYAPTELDVLNDPSTFGECIYSHADWSHAYASTRKESEYTIKAENIVEKYPKELRRYFVPRGTGKFEARNSI